MTARNPPPLAAFRRTAIPLVVAAAPLLGLPAAPPAVAASDAELATALDTLFAEADPAGRPAPPCGSRRAAGYFLLGAVVEAVAGTRYEDFVETRIFEPLGMERSPLRARATGDQAIPRSRALRAAAVRSVTPSLPRMLLT